MKITWIAVMLLIVGVAVWAIRKKIGETGTAAEKKSDIQNTVTKAETVSSIQKEQKQTFEEKLVDVYSGKVDSATTFNTIRTDTTLTDEQKAKLEFEAIMQEWWPMRSKLRGNALQYSGKYPVPKKSGYSIDWGKPIIQDVNIELEPGSYIAFPVQMTLKQPKIEKGFVVKFIDDTSTWPTGKPTPEGMDTRFKNYSMLFPMKNWGPYGKTLLGFYKDDALFDKAKFMSQNDRLNRLQYAYPWVMEDIRVKAVLNSSNL